MGVDIIKHKKNGDRIQQKEVILVTGSSGLIGFSLIQKLAKNYRIVGLDRVGPPYPPLEAECVNFDITNEESIAMAMERIRYGYGNKIAAVIHLAAFYSFKTKENDLYNEINIEGTHKFLSQLRDFDVKQFIFSSTDLLYKPINRGQKIDENSPINASWGYPRSKILTEDVIKQYNQYFKTVILRVAGVYNEYGHSIPISNQIKRIYEKEPTSHFYSGNLNHGDAYVHLEDLLSAIIKTIEKQNELKDHIIINIGEPYSPSYKELQTKIGKLIYGKQWKTYKIPKWIAIIGAWGMNITGDSFIKPWMINRAGENYELDINRAKELLDWEPKNSLLETMPFIIKNLRANPAKWYTKNKL
ncbi:NAD(P)-dependent oxidoreductase [Galbibacter orientalis]|uniref:NAD-dependent epimerase/dehydratase family protein n=1 Tax=Galbibacter orientalis TaxID=453852 RepID=UPI00307FFC08